MYIICILYPDLHIFISAQTKENAKKLVKEKHDEIIKYYPMILSEISNISITKDSAEITFVSGSMIDTMANSPNSLGARRHRANIEEAAILNNELFEYVLEPIVNIPRRTLKNGTIDAMELSGQINFLTTAGYKGTDEYTRSLKMVQDMINLKGKMVLGASYELACRYNRGETLSQLLDKKSKLNIINWHMNYCSIWGGNTDNVLVSLTKLLSLRTLEKPELRRSKDGEYAFGIDIARSQDTANAQTSLSVFKIIRASNKKIIKLQLVNIVNISNALTFTQQAIELKIAYYKYNPIVICMDTNGLGVGLCDEMHKEHIAPKTGAILPCFKSMNTDQQAETNNVVTCIYDLKPQSANHDVIVSFIDSVESGKLELLIKKNSSDFTQEEYENTDYKLAFINTDFLIDEVSNLKLKQLPSGKFSIEKVVSKIQKDRFSSAAYVNWYVKTFEDYIESNSDEFKDLEGYFGFF